MRQHLSCQRRSFLLRKMPIFGHFKYSNIAALADDRFSLTVPSVITIVTLTKRSFYEVTVRDVVVTKLGYVISY